MPVSINGSTGISGIDGTAGTPALQGSDTDTGISFGTDEVAINTGGVQRASFDGSGNIDLGPLDISGSASADSVNIDSSGRLLVGTASASSNNILVAQGYPGDPNEYGTFSLQRGTAPGTTDTIGLINFNGEDNRRAAVISAVRDGGTWTSGSSHPGYLAFATTANGASSPTERMRINNTGIAYTYSNTTCLYLNSNTGAGTSQQFLVGNYGSTQTTGTGTASIRIYTNGNIQNTNNSYGSLSDIKLKENVVDASSQWDDIKGLQVRNYNFIEGQTHTQIGVIAQEVETVSPGLVTESPDRDEEGNDLGTVTKSVNYSVLYMKAVKALQEAMERIETLEAKVAALEGGAS